MEKFMKPHKAALAIFLILATMVGCGRAQGQAIGHHARVRVYFVAAEEVDWDYVPSRRDDAMGQPFDDSQKNYVEPGPNAVGHIYKKAVYREYTDARFSTLKPRPANEGSLGILGPVLRGEVGDTIKVIFKNKASRPYSMHPHGVLYAKSSEGSMYNDNSGDSGKDGGMVPPGKTHDYIWQIPERAGPGPNDPSSIVWLYHSHVDELRDIASGLFGPIIITARGKARDDGGPADVDREFVTVFITVNENESWYSAQNMPNIVKQGPQSTAGVSSATHQDYNLRQTINGFSFGDIPMMTMRKGERVRWYVATLGDSNNFHTPHWHGNVVLQEGHRSDVISLLPAQTATVNMVPDNVGIWLFHCHVSDHMAGGMVARYEVQP
jgi:FtsP/CotA-like multicopper oxidase with cupredoxin domain